MYFIGYNPIISHFYNITDATKTRRPSILALGGKKQKKPTTENISHLKRQCIAGLVFAHKQNIK